MAFDFLVGKKHLSCFLVTIQTPDGVFYRIVDEKSFSVGRSLDCALSFPDPNISRVHVVISSRKDQVYLIDQGSANGTFVNTQKILPNKLTLVQPSDDVKLGTSEIHLKIDLFEKAYKQDELVNSLLPDNEKNTLMEVIQGAHQQAKRIIQQAQEHYDKLIKTAEAKVRNVENSLLIKQDEIIAAANVQANQITQEGKKKAAQIVFDAEQKATEATKDIFAKAEETKVQADAYYQGKISEAQVKGDEIVQNHTDMGQKLLQEANDKSQELRKKATDEGEQIRLKARQESQDILVKAEQDGLRLKEEHIENAKREMQTRLADLMNQITAAEKALSDVENQKAKTLQSVENEIKLQKEMKEREAANEVDKKRQELELQLTHLRADAQRAESDRDEAIRRKQEELTVLMEKHDLELRRMNEIKEIEFKKKVEDLSFAVTRSEKELERLSEQKDQKIKSQQLELDQAYQKHLLELEKVTTAKEKEMRDKVDQELKAQKQLIHDSESQVQKIKVEITEAENLKLKAIKDFEVETEHLAKLKEKIQKTLNEQKTVEASYQNLLVQIQQFDAEKKQSTEKIKELETRASHLKMLVEGENKKIQDLARDYDVKVKEHKQKLENEFEALRKEKEAQFRESFNAEAENAKQMRFHLVQEIQSKQNLIIKDIHSKMIKIIASQGTKDNLTELSDLAMKQIKNSFEETIATISTQNQASKIDTAEIRKQQQRMKNKWLASGLTMGLVLMGGFHLWNEKVKNRSLASVLAEQQQEREAEYERRRFNPEQTYEVRDNYTDSVIYTKDFVELYQDKQLQDRWVRDTRQYFFKSWRVEEEKTIEVLSMAKTLVKALNDKKQNIHPDFVEKNIEDMRKLEEETTNKMRTLLGTDVKFSAFKRFEKKFFMNEIARRMPAETFIDPNVEGSD